MARALPIGVQDFKEIRDSDLLYVDKSDMISKILSEGTNAYLFTRPRRFGKSLNLSMLDAFFNLKYPKDNGWFDGLKVSECGECRKHKNAYPVIYFDFKDLDSTSHDMFLKKLGYKLSRLYSQYLYLLDSDSLDDVDRCDFDSVFRRTADEVVIGYSLKNLSDMLFKHHGKRVIILLDEYDNPIHGAYGESFHSEVLQTMRGVLSSSLKGNESLMFGVITGVMQIAKESIFSGLNNLEVNNVLSTDFDEMFGFTDGEVMAICDEYGHPEKYAEAKEWYDGYRFGDADVYNPWSIIRYVKSNFDPQTYWAGTSGNSILDDLFKSASPGMWDEFRSLAQRDPIVYSVTPTITFQDLHADERNIYSMLVMSGYLTAKHIDEGVSYISLPNGEMSRVFGDMILKRLNTDSSVHVRRLAKVLVACDVSAIERHLYDLFASSAGNAMLNDEHSYQAFITGMLMFLFGRYSVRADFEEGNGRYDIRLERRFGDSPNIVIEIKRVPTDSSDDAAESAARKALGQIHERDYLHGLSGDTLLYGIAFRNKMPTVLSERVVL